MKKILVSVVLLTFIFNLSAQKIGVMGGINLANINSSDNIKYDMVTGINASVFFQKTIFPMVSVRPAIGLTQRGYQYEFIGVTTKNMLNYGGLNIDLRFKPPVIPIYLVAGPYTGYAISGTTTTSIGDIETTSDITFDKDHTNPFDFGISVGGGYVKNLVLAKLFVEAKYEMGMVDLYPSYNETYKNSNIKISLGFMFGL